MKNARLTNQHQHQAKNTHDAIEVFLPLYTGGFLPAYKTSQMASGNFSKAAFFKPTSDIVVAEISTRSP